MAALYAANDYIDLNDFKNAGVHLSGAEALADQVQSSNLFYKLYLTYGRLHQKTKEYRPAVDSYKKAMEYVRQTGNVFSQMNVLRQLGFAYRDMKAYPESIKALEEALRLIRQLDNKRLEAETVKKLGDVLTLQQHYREASAYYQQYIMLKDSLNEAETKKKINEIENKYQAERKHDSILVLQKDSQLQKLALRKKGNQNIGIIIGAALLLLVAFLVYRNLRNKHRLLEQHEALHAQRILELEKERQLVAMQSVMKGQEEERSRLARDLHDGVGGLLSGVKLSLSTMKGNVFLPEEHAQSVNNVLTQLDRSITELRRVSHNMMPEALIKFGLKETLENYCENINLSGTLKVQLQTYGMDERMEQNTEIVLYRIVQELLNNVIKHAEAKNVLIQLIRKDSHFSLTVEDDGRGFDPDTGRKEGAGLSNIRARVDYLGGTIDVRSAPGEGTSVNIEGNEG
jgi:signal transduction histidine kinase